MLLGNWLCSRPIAADFHKHQFLPRDPTSKPKLSYNYTLKRCCLNFEDKKNKPLEGFSVLEKHVPWDDAWSTMALYMFGLHFPLSFGGLSIVAYILHQPVLDPQTQALSLFLIQSSELASTLFLLKSTAKPQFKLTSLYKANELSKNRSWFLASVLGFGFLLVLVLLTSLLAERFFGSKEVNNPILKEILLSNDISRAACILVYCIITPLLEETIYRGFLLASLSKTMKWQHATVISSLIFSAAHLSGENFLQLFVIGWILGCSYCWSGNLRSSILIHSWYNAFTILITFLS